LFRGCHGDLALTLAGVLGAGGRGGRLSALGKGGKGRKINLEVL
jgi:hypothetical protein